MPLHRSGIDTYLFCQILDRHSAFLSIPVDLMANRLSAALPNFRRFRNVCLRSVLLLLPRLGFETAYCIHVKPFFFLMRRIWFSTLLVGTMRASVFAGVLLPAFRGRKVKRIAVDGECLISPVAPSRRNREGAGCDLRGQWSASARSRAKDQSIRK